MDSVHSAGASTGAFLPEERAIAHREYVELSRREEQLLAQLQDVRRQMERYKNAHACGDIPSLVVSLVCPQWLLFPLST